MVEYMVKYMDILSELSPKVLLDHYWTVLETINTSFSIYSKFATQDISKYFLNKISSANNSYYLRNYIRAQKVINEIIVKLAKINLLKKVDNYFEKTDGYSEFFTFLKKNIKNSAKNRVSWAIWYIYNNKKHYNFTTSQILDTLSYSDEDYLGELGYLSIWKNSKYFPILKKNESASKWEMVDVAYSSEGKSIIIEDLQRRLFTAISRLHRDFSSDEIIQEIRELEKESIEKILKNLKLNLKDGYWWINDTALSRIRKNLEGKPFLNWPSFGNIVVIGQPYFKILRGSSCKAYVDVPNEITKMLIEELAQINSESKNIQEFYTKAYKVIDDYNDFLRKHGKKYFGYPLEWLSFSLYKSGGMDRYAIKVNINWDKFMDFLNVFSKTNIKIWKKYQYISICRYPSLNLVLKKELEQTQRNVRNNSSIDIANITEQIDIFINYLENTKNQIMKLLKRKKWKGLVIRSSLHPEVLLYLVEMMSTIKMLKDIINNGMLTSCYRELRKILEGLGWAIFDDILLIRSIIRSINRNINWLLAPPYRYASKEWYEIASLKKDFTLRNLGVLKNKIKGYTAGIRNSYKKDILNDALINIMSYGSFLLFFGVNAEKIGEEEKEFIPIYDIDILLPIAKEDFKAAARSAGIISDELVDEIMKNFKDMPQKIFPPYPSNEFVLSFIDKTFSTGLQAKYSEYSFFIHSYLTSWHIFPFSSILEFKILNSEISIFLQIIKDVLEKYLEYLEAHPLVNSSSFSEV